MSREARRFKKKFVVTGKGCPAQQKNLWFLWVFPVAAWRQEECSRVPRLIEKIMGQSKPR
jgi:hypothetical protein